MRFIIGGKIIVIELSFGIHAAEDDSAMGKTYLVKLLQAGVATGSKEYSVITYFEGISSDFVVKQLKQSKYSFIMLDRLDLYLSEEMAVVLSDIRESTCIFVDLKNWNRTKVLCPNLVELEFTERGFRLYEGNDI